MKEQKAIVVEPKYIKALWILSGLLVIAVFYVANVWASMHPQTLPLQAFPKGTLLVLHQSFIINSQQEYSVYLNNTYLALTPLEQEQGFMNQINAGYGYMLFVFGNNSIFGASPCFWMKDTEFPLQLAYINSQGYVTSDTILSAYSTQPYCASGVEVLEITSNSTLYGNITTGDYVDYVQ